MECFWIKVNINKIHINTHKNKSTKLTSAMEKEFNWHWLHDTYRYWRDDKFPKDEGM
jgi:hypothetical protein